MGQGADAETISLLRTSNDSNSGQAQIQHNQEHAEDTYCCCLKWGRSGHWCAAIALVLVIASLGFFVATYFLDFEDERIQTASYIALGVALLVYWIEVLSAGTLRYLVRFNTNESIVEYIERVRSHKPKITFHCEVSFFVMLAIQEGH